MSRQGEEIAAVFNSWKGKNAQIDDVLVVGIEI
jgi:hypothetical protein